MSDNFTIRQGPARYQIEEILELNNWGHSTYGLNNTYRDYRAYLNEDPNKISINFSMYRHDEDEFERNHLCPKFDLANMEKIVHSVDFSGDIVDDFPSVDGESGMLLGVEWEEYPGHEEFAHDLYKLRDRLDKVDRYLEEVEEAGNRIANELSRSSDF